MTPRHPSRQRGAAVIGALIIVAIVAALSTSLFLRQTATMRQVENEEARVQARWLLMGGIDWARLMLRDHARREATTQGDQVWATPVQDTRIEQPGDDRVAVFSGFLEDEQGKYNLYNVAIGGKVSEAQLEILTRLLSNLNQPASLAPQMANLIAQAQPPAPVSSSEQTSSTGTTTSSASEAAEEALLAKAQTDAPLPRGIDDIANLLGVDQVSRQALRRTMTVLPARTTVNVNTAPPEVIAALVPGLSLGQARSLAGDRDRGRWFLNSGDFGNRVTGTGSEVQVPTVVTTSTWFMATGTVVYERARVTMRALMQSSTGGAPRTLWTQEVM
ncbi:general secretion pathway protein K [Bordetella ansorpii]|uniref:Type II secretion system protein K n=1 Tax=Bordetella ansorpii TaxID=288768 RepID=A0A157Q1T5_9BORD|nr:type II secretion system minor pseudopilin GspK [Bordetella ansorpii]SAI39544.1 general secretion pathway protein K [Bordetella ansorpii]